MVIYANQTLRTAHMAMKELLQKMIKAESISEFDEEMSTMQQIFELQEMYNLKNKEKEIEEELKKNKKWNVKEFFKSNYIVNKNVNAWLCLSEIVK